MEFMMFQKTREFFFSTQNNKKHFVENRKWSGVGVGAPHLRVYQNLIRGEQPQSGLFAR